MSFYTEYVLFEKRFKTALKLSFSHLELLKISFKLSKENRYTDNISIIFSVYQYRKFLIPNIPTFNVINTFKKVLMPNPGNKYS